MLPNLLQSIFLGNPAEHTASLTAAEEAALVARCRQGPSRARECRRSGVYSDCSRSIHVISSHPLREHGSALTTSLISISAWAALQGKGANEGRGQYIVVRGATCCSIACCQRCNMLLHHRVPMFVNSSSRCFRALRCGNLYLSVDEALWHV